MIHFNGKSIVILTLSLMMAGLFLILPVSNAAVPTYVVEQEAGTKFEQSLEKFMFNLFTALSQKQEDFTQAFELAKIEKAREDVSKLTLQVEKELKAGNEVIDQTINGQTIKIKTPPRIIEDVDAFLFEEPIQKARDFIYCTLNPGKRNTQNTGWTVPPRDYPLGDDIGAYCDTKTGWDRNDSEKCNANRVCGSEGLNILVNGRCPQDATTKICDALGGTRTINSDGTITDTRCPSRQTRDNLRDSLINAIKRREIKGTPPQEWYYNNNDDAVCKIIFKMNFCDPQAGSACEALLKPNLNIPLGYQRQTLQLNDLLAVTAKSVNQFDSLRQQLVDTVQSIINSYQQIRLAQYQAGQGVRGEKYLYGLQCNNCPTGSDDYYYIDTEHTLNPGIFLINKVAAANQAEFDLARMAFKIPSNTDTSSTHFERVTTPTTEIRNNDQNQSQNLIGTIPDWIKVNRSALETEQNSLPSPSNKPNYPALTAPWEDQQNYAKIPKEYIPPSETKVMREWCTVQIGPFCIASSQIMMMTAIANQRFSEWWWDFWKPKGDNELIVLLQRWFDQVQANQCTIFGIIPNPLGC